MQLTVLLTSVGLPCSGTCVSACSPEPRVAVCHISCAAFEHCAAIYLKVLRVVMGQAAYHSDEYVLLRRQNRSACCSTAVLV